MLSSNHKPTHPCYNTAQKLKMRWSTSMTISSRGLCCPRSIPCGVGVFRYCSTREPILSSCNNNILYNKVYIIKTLVFCIHILTVCMTTWSWAYIRWASGFDLKTECHITFAHFETRVTSWSKHGHLMPERHRCSASKLSNDPNSLCAKLIYGLVLTSWCAHPNCNSILNCAGSSRNTLR
jgi:hypothetical protein